jgi:hypothetical protein
MQMFETELREKQLSPLFNGLHANWSELSEYPITHLVHVIGGTEK